MTRLGSNARFSASPWNAVQSTCSGVAVRGDGALPATVGRVAVVVGVELR